MRELSPSPAPLDWQSDKAADVRLVTVRDVRFSGVCGGEGDTVVVAAHRAGRGGSLCYLTVGPDGVEEVLTEDVRGARAALMSGPDRTPWVRMSLLEDGVDQEPDTVLPLRGRSDWERAPRTSAFAGDFVGWIGNRAFWHLDDVFDERKPSRIQAADLSQVRATGLPHLHSFANGLELDRAAVDAGLTLRYHNGRTEGVNTTTKKIMRQMHGRAGFPLLRQRILLQ